MPAPLTQLGPRRPHLWFAAVFGLAVVLRLCFIGGPWSGRAPDFHSHFGAWAVGEPAQIMVEQGALVEGGMPVFWRVELDGPADPGAVADKPEVARHVYSHHPALYTQLVALSMRVFGEREWAVRLVPFGFSLFALVAAFGFMRRRFGDAVALFSAAWMAALPLFAWYGMLAWTEGVLVGIGVLQLGAYARWLEADSRGSARRAFLVMCAWQFLAVLFDWTGAFMCVGIGLHALCFGQGKRFLKLLWLGVPIFLAAGIHALHMALVLGTLHQTSETKATLAAVTELPTETLLEFVHIQFNHARRLLGWPAFVATLVGFLVLVARRLAGKLTETEGLVIALLTPGLLYIALFPQRSYNHDFFLMLSMPGLGVLGAWAVIALCGRVSGRALLAVGLVCVGVGTWRALEVHAVRRSDQMPVIAASLATSIAPADGLVLTHFGRGMALPFYANAAVLHNINEIAPFRARMTEVVERTAPDRPAHFVFDMMSEEQLTSRGALKLLGQPSLDEVGAAFTAFAAAKPRAELESLMRTFLHPLLVPLHQHLCATYASEVIAADRYGVFQVFDLRAPLAAGE